MRRRPTVGAHLGETIAIFLGVCALIVTLAMSPSGARAHGRRRHQPALGIAPVSLDSDLAISSGTSTSLELAVRDDGAPRAGTVGGTFGLPVPDIEVPLVEKVSEFLLARRQLLVAMDALHEAEHVGRHVEAVERVRLLCREVLRRHTAVSFAAEIASAGGEHGVLRDALEAATSWESWNHLRTDLGRSPRRAERAMEMLVRTTVIVATRPTRGSPDEL